MATNENTEQGIFDLIDVVTALPAAKRRLFDRIYDVEIADAHLKVPQAMAPWVERTFGVVSSVETQRIVRVSNKVIGEGTLFNGLRARRPVRPTLRAEADFSAELVDDAWADPLRNTPEDPFGRLSNDHAITAANVAKYDALHSILVFKEPDPLAFTEESVVAQVRLASEWLATAHAHDPRAAYPYLMWNCLWRSGGSIVHGHSQVSLARGRHYAKIERLRSDTAAYRSQHDANLFDDLWAVHQSLGLAQEVTGVRVLVHLTPLKEKEVVLVAPALDDRAAFAIYWTLSRFRDRLGVRSFNMGALMPPLGVASEDWTGFPVVIRIVDRGDLSTRTSDIGGMEMFAEPVVAADPFQVYRALTEDG